MKSSRARPAAENQKQKRVSTSMKRETKNRIPIRFVDEGGSNARLGGGGEDDQSSLEEQNAASDLTAGRAATDDNAIEAGRGIDNDPKQATTGGRERIDAFDVASAFDQADLPETGHRGSTISPVDNQNSTADTFGDNAQTTGTSQQAGAATGPAFAELLATRAELARVEADLRKAATERQDAINRLARLQADFENSRKRFERERSETYNRVLGEIVGSLLPVTDNLRRALHARESMQTDDSAEFR
ncbi:MAG: nucleotide exchange factor GrpE, partial [Pyrinomonadaceae bacterium]|nr:nucleotide exchange factor GrpE [Pyrinomonadaceae bacterium]